MPKRNSKKKPRTGFRRWVGYCFARLLVSGLHYLPLPVAYYTGRGVGWAAWKLLAKRRAVVAKNLTVVNEFAPEQAPEMSLEEQVCEVFQRTGANMLSSFCFARMSPVKIEKHLTCEGVEHFEAALSAKKGVLVLLAHMGPWEVLAYLSILLGGRGYDVRLAAMYRPMNNQYFDQWFKSVREQRGTRLFSRDDGFHKPVDFLREGGVLGVLADQTMNRGAIAPFFARDVPTSPLPGLFQRRSGASSLAVSVVTVAPMRWKVVARAVNYPTAEGERTRENEAVVSNQALEQILAEDVLDGFWLHDRFKPYNKKRLRKQN